MPRQNKNRTLKRPRDVSRVKSSKGTILDSRESENVNNSRPDKRTARKSVNFQNHGNDKLKSRDVSRKYDSSGPINKVDVEINTKHCADVQDSEANTFTQFISCFAKKNTKFSSESEETDTDDEAELVMDANSEVLEDGIQVDENAESEDDDDEVDDIDELDSFCQHFETVLDDEFASDLRQSTSNCSNHDIRWPELGQMNFASVRRNKPKLVKDAKNFYIKDKLLANVKSIGSSNDSADDQQFSGFQRELLSVISKYVDLYYPLRTFDNGEEIRVAYCVHALNHVLKTRSRVIRHNSRISKRAKDDLTEYRDHGLTRPKVLIVLPFKECALRVVSLFQKLLLGDGKINVLNRKRFQDEFSVDKEEERHYKNKKITRPEDFEATFAGNVDDAFRVGVTITKKSIRLYADFYSADIIIASPLGLRTIIGAEGEKDRETDFLSSIEVLIVDQADVFLMQNWEHVLHIANNLHQQPKQSHGVDFSRVRMWCLNGWSKYYRQSLVFSSVALPQITSLFNRFCQNYAGKVKVLNKVETGCIGRIITQLPQVYHRIDASSAMDVADARFNFFVKKILPHHKDAVMSHTLVFIPSYFDFVRVRNYMKKEETSVCTICEYTKNAKVSRARNLFFHGKRHFLLYTERFHFYHRYKIKGIRHLIFYELPSNPHFYSELCNYLHGTTENMTSTILYTKYEAMQLSQVLGSQRASQIIGAEKSIHMFVTGEH